MSSLFEPTPDHAALRTVAADFSRSHVLPQAATQDRLENFNVELFRLAGKLGLLGILAPAASGGTEMDAVAAVILHEELAAADPGFALASLSHSVLFIGGLVHGASAEVCASVLPEACLGLRIGAVAMSEPNAGSDLLSMRTVARRASDGYVIDGVKTWITNGALSPDQPADCVLVYARTSDAGPSGLSLFLVECDAPGFSLGRVITGKLGMRSSACAELVFRECVVPVSHRIGPEGAALIHLMRTFEIERLTLAAISLGLARRALHIMNEYATSRQIAGQPLRSFGQIQRHLAESYAAWQAGRCLAYHTAARLDLSRPSEALDCDAVKLFCGAMAKKVCDRAIQVLGGNGYVEGFEVDRLWRDSRLIEIGGGASEILQKNITRHLKRVHL